MQDNAMDQLWFLSDYNSTGVQHVVINSWNVIWGKQLRFNGEIKRQSVCEKSTLFAWAERPWKDLYNISR